MSILAIIGAGTLGGALAHRAASHDLWREVRLIDDARGVAAGKALDVLQAGPIEGFGTTVVGDAGPSAATGADVVVLTGPAAGPASEWGADDGLDRLRQAAASAASTSWSTTPGSDASRRSPSSPSTTGRR